MSAQEIGRITDESEQRQLVNRLRRLTGQVRGIKAMVAEDKECEAVLTQVMAARSALGKIGLHVTGYSMKRCLADDTSTGDELVDDAFETFLRYRRLGSDAVPTARQTPSTPEEMTERLEDLEEALGVVEEVLISGGACERLVTDIGSATAILGDVALGVLGHSMRQCLVDTDAPHDDVIDEAVCVFLKYASCLD